MADFSGDKTATTFDNLRKIIYQENLSLGVAIPAIVDSFDPDTQMIEATPVIRRRTREDDGSLAVEDRLKQIKIPACMPFVRTLGFSITMPLQPGDQVMFVIQDRGIDLWQETGEISDPPDLEEVRAHQYTDAIYIIGPIDLATPIIDYQIDSIEVRNEDRTCALQIWDDAAQVRAPLTNRTTWDEFGSITSFAPIDISEIALGDITEDAAGDIIEEAIGDISSLSVAGKISRDSALGHETETLLSITEDAGTSIEMNAGTFITLEAGSTILIDGAGKVTISSDVEVEIIAPSVRLSATTVYMIAPTVNMSGNLNVTGTVTAAGFSGPASAAASFTNGLTTPSATINGIASETHKHNETGTQTGIPIAGP